MSEIPKVIKNYNLFIDGRGYAGKIDEMRLPDLTIVTEDHRAGGMDGPIALDMGMEGLEVGFTCAEHNEEIYKLFGLQNQNAVGLTFRAAMVDDLEVVPFVIRCTGLFTQLSGGTVQNGRKSPLSVTGRLRFYELGQGGNELVYIDFVRMIRRINGVDQLQGQREALQI